MSINTLSVKFLIVLIFLSFFNESFSQDSDARDYTNVPKNLNVTLLSYMHTTGNTTFTDQHFITETGKINVNVGYIKHQSFFSIGGKTAGINVAIPVGKISGTGTINIDTEFGTLPISFSESASGFADCIVAFGMNIFGGPSLPMEQFLKWKQKTIMSGSLQVSVPMGQYNKSDVLNMGKHTWGFKPEIILSQAAGNWMFEVYANANFTTNNTAFDSLTLKQSPVFGLDFHPSYTIFPEALAWISFDALYRVGGKTKVNDFEIDSGQNNLRLGATFHTNLSFHSGIKLQYMKTAAKKSTEPDTWSLTASYIYAW